DCSPAVQECPFCAQQQQQDRVSTEILAMVKSLRNVPSVPLLTAAPEQYLLFGLTNGDSIVTKGTAVLFEERQAYPARETIEITVRPLVESALVESAPGSVAAAIEVDLATLSAAQPPLTGTPPISAAAPIEK